MELKILHTDDGLRRWTERRGVYLWAREATFFFLLSEPLPTSDYLITDRKMHKLTRVRLWLFSVALPNSPRSRKAKHRNRTPAVPFLFGELRPPPSPPPSSQCMFVLLQQILPLPSAALSLFDSRKATDTASRREDPTENYYPIPRPWIYPLSGHFPPRDDDGLFFQYFQSPAHQIDGFSLHFCCQPHTTQSSTYGLGRFPIPKREPIRFFYYFFFSQCTQHKIIPIFFSRIALLLNTFTHSRNFPYQTAVDRMTTSI